MTVHVIILGTFFSVHSKTTLNDQILRCVENVNHDS